MSSVWRKKMPRLRKSCFTCSYLKPMGAWLVRQSSSDHSLASSPLSLPCLLLLAALGAELEKLHHYVGHLMDYVRASCTSLIEHLDNAQCRIWDIVDFDKHLGATVELLMGEICSNRSLQDIVDCLLRLLDEGLEDI